MTYSQARRWFENHRGALLKSADMRSKRAVELYSMLNGSLSKVWAKDIAEVMRSEFIQVMLDLREIHGMSRLSPHETQ